MTTIQAFNYLLTRCKDVSEVRKEAENLVLMKPKGSSLDKAVNEIHFFFMDAKRNKLVLEPKNSRLMAYDNPYGVLTNGPEFPWHETNLKNYLNVRPENIDKQDVNGVTITKFGEGSGAVGLPGDFTSPSRSIRSAHFVSNTPKDLKRNAAILQGFRILPQSDTPAGAVIDPKEGNNDETIYTAVMDTKKKGYSVKYHDNINVQSFYMDDCMDDCKNLTEITTLDVQKEMEL